MGFSVFLLYRALYRLSQLVVAVASLCVFGLSTDVLAACDPDAPAAAPVANQSLGDCAHVAGYLGQIPGTLNPALSLNVSGDYTLGSGVILEDKFGAGALNILGSTDAQAITVKALGDLTLSIENTNHPNALQYGLSVNTIADRAGAVDFTLDKNAALVVQQTVVAHSPGTAVYFAGQNTTADLSGSVTVSATKEGDSGITSDGDAAMFVLQKAKVTVLLEG